MKRRSFVLAAVFTVTILAGAVFSLKSVNAQRCFTASDGGGTTEVSCGAVLPGVNLDPDKCYSAGGLGPTEVSCSVAADTNNESESPVGDAGDVGGSGSSELDRWLNTTINVLSAFIGIAIVISILVASIQYITAGGNASQVSAAKQRITMAVLGFALFLMGYSILQWLIPGGIW
jgi:hypothetical protein